MHKESDVRKSIVQMAAIAVGVLLIASLTLLE